MKCIDYLKAEPPVYGHSMMVLLCAALMVLACSTAASARNSIVLTNGEWPPLTSKHLRQGGLLTELCTRAFALEGIDAQYEYLPWKRARTMAAEGQYLGTLAWRRSPDWENQFYYSDMIYSIKTVFFHRADTDFSWNTLNDVGKKKIGATRGFLYISLLKPIIEANRGRLDVANDDYINMMKLSRGRVDLFPCAEIVGYYLLNKYKDEITGHITRYDKPIMAGELYLLVSKKLAGAQQVVETFNRGLGKLRASGEYDRIVKRWKSGDGS